ncbi:DUF317 domain-containing protein [Streptomyces sp. ID05-39B]|uniref:DUF317 domain-containing protein n=1 Tax=Streptomyces sp. ID05-39B TaxID=3028664 RepID=UPI0029A375AB|nr:DUF317 domain-containing protein [Streptomyces sp. ID05-39B]MDX3525885.1 DUF317 domain-containing protein [Streptomyces sp. ID05-39B]
MPVSGQQLEEFARRHAWRIPFDTSPRHLAGPGDARHVTHGLAAAGWKRTSDPLSPEIVLSSPDHRYRLDFVPESGTFAWWRLWAGSTDTEPGWTATFGELVPAEVLAGFTDALVAPAPTEHSSPLDVVDAAGWLLDTRGAASSTDAACRLERRSDSLLSWQVEVHDPDRGRHGPRLWHASFDDRTPGHLVNAFLTALVDPAPLQRGMGDRTAHHSAVQRPSPLRPEQIVEAHTDRLNSIRAKVRAARRQNSKPSTSPAAPAAARPAARR